MKPQEQAKELIREFYTIGYRDLLTEQQNQDFAKECALITADEYIQMNNDISKYWAEVKEEIEKL